MPVAKTLVASFRTVKREFTRRKAKRRTFHSNNRYGIVVYLCRQVFNTVQKLFLICCSDSLVMAAVDSKSTTKMNEINSHELLQLQCKIASDRIHLVDIETKLADTSTQLTNERAKNKSLVKIVYYLENVIEKMKDQYNGRVSNITNMLKLQAENNLKKTLEEKLKTVTAAHFQAMENLRQEHRHQIKISNKVTSPIAKSIDEDKNGLKLRSLHKL